MTPSEYSKTSKSGTTMTSEPKPGAPASGSWDEVWVAGKDLPPGIPDPAVLARIANEFFTALPDLAQLNSLVPGSPAQIPAVPVESTAAPQGVAGIAPSAFPTEAELRALPAA